MSHSEPSLFASRAASFDLAGVSGFSEAVVRRVGYKLRPHEWRENPYLLTQVWGVGFKLADRVAMALGVSKNAPARQAAAAGYVLSEAEGEGHTCLPVDDFAARLVEVLGDPVDGCEIDETVSADDGFFALAKTREAERRAASILSGLLAVGVSGLDSVADGLVEDQAAALLAIQRSRVFCLLGSPGTGKTTLIRALVASNEGCRIAICAPTGKAAKRVQEATGSLATTIHRLLRVNPDGAREGEESHSLNFSFTYNRKRKLPVNMVIVDESSMVDTRLFADLLEALRPDCRLVLIGDTHQLPSVGPGRVLGDLVDSGEVPFVELVTLKRSDPNLQIARNCARLKSGEVPAVDNAAFTDFFFIPAERPEDIANEIVSLHSERLPKKYELDPQRDIVTLTALREGKSAAAGDPILSAAGLNARLRRVFNPSAPLDKKDFAQGDRVIQLTNNYDFDVMNGDTGTVAIRQGELVTISWDTPPRDTTTRIKELNLAHAWALTVHKFQGSEIPWCIIPVHRSNGSLVATRQHLYTAISRGKQGVVLVGSWQEVEAVVSRTREQRRWTRLASLLRE